MGQGVFSNVPVAQRFHPWSIIFVVFLFCVSFFSFLFFLFFFLLLLLLFFFVGFFVRVRRGVWSQTSLKFDPGRVDVCQFCLKGLS